MRGWRRRGGAIGTVLLVATVVPLTMALPAVAGGGCHRPATEGTGDVVVMDEACFGPTILRVAPGTKVTWTNKDPMTHVVAGQGYGWGSPSDLSQGDRFSAVFRNKGVYPYTCYLHPGMNGAVVVGNVGAPTLSNDGVEPQSDPAVTRDAPQPPQGPSAGESISARPASVRSSAGLWPLATAIGFALAFVTGIALVRTRRRRLSPPAEHR